MKPLIFKFCCAFTCLLFGGFWIECGTFDALFCTITVISGIMFLADWMTHFDEEDCGIISKILFKKK